MGNNRGFSLVGAMVGGAVLAIIASGFATMMSMQYKQARDLSQKVETLELRNSLMTVFTNANVCGCNFNPTQNTGQATDLKFDGSDLANASMTITEVYSRCGSTGEPELPLLTANEKVPGTQTELRVERMEIRDFADTGTTDQLQATLYTYFSEVGATRGRAPLQMRLNLLVDSATPTASTIVSCAAGSMPPGSGGGGGGGPTTPPSTVTGCVLSAISACPTGTMPTSCVGIVFNPNYGMGALSMSSVGVNPGKLIDPSGSYLFAGTTPFVPDPTKDYSDPNERSFACNANIPNAPVSSTPQGGALYTCCPP